MPETKIVWSLNEVLPELKDNNDNIDDIIREYVKFNERIYSQPLKNMIDEIYYDLNVPIDVINLITIFNYGGIVYNYSKRFVQFTQNTIYIIPIIFGYIETLLLFLICCLSFTSISGVLLPLSLVYIALLIIHAICSLIAYHKCKSYEQVIRNFKRILYNNDNFVTYITNNINTELQDIANKQNIELITIRGNDDNNYGSNHLLTVNERKEMEIYDNDNNSKYDENWNWTLTYNTGEYSDKLLSIILNPSNNSFAFIGYQRWLNLKGLALENDAFTRSPTVLCLSLSKYWLPSYFGLSFIMLLYYPYIISVIIWWIVFMHSFYGLMYCYFRVVLNIDKRYALIMTVVTAVINDILGITITTAIITSDDETDGDSNEKNKTKDASFWILDVFCPVLYILFIIVFSRKTIKILYNILKFNRNLSNPGCYSLWWCCLMIFVMIDALLSVPSWRYKVSEITIIPFGLIIIFYYMNVQQLCHRIITGMKVKDYSNKFIANNPQKWLKQELKLLFIPYIK